MTIKQAYASANETPIQTIEITHSGLTGGVLRYVEGRSDITATLSDEASTPSVTFAAVGLSMQIPKRSVDGSQDLTFAFDNTSREASDELKAVIESARTTKESAIIKVRYYLPSDLTTVADGPYLFQAKASSRNRKQVTITGSYFKVGALRWPFRIYDTTTYPGVKYA